MIQSYALSSINYCLFRFEMYVKHTRLIDTVDFVIQTTLDNNVLHTSLCASNNNKPMFVHSLL